MAVIRTSRTDHTASDYLVRMPAEGRAAPAARYQALDAYGGLAALLVVVFHAYQFSREGPRRWRRPATGSSSARRRR